MKRSDFVGPLIERGINQGLGPAAAAGWAHYVARGAEDLGATWDPEEPEVEVLWEGATGADGWQYRLVRTIDGAAWQSGRRGKEETFTEPRVSVACASALAELARRILAERQPGACSCQVARQLEQQLEAQKQIEECLRSEIRALKADRDKLTEASENFIFWLKDFWLKGGGS